MRVLNEHFLFSHDVSLWTDRNVCVCRNWQALILPKYLEWFEWSSGLRTRSVGLEMLFNETLRCFTQVPACITGRSVHWLHFVKSGGWEAVHKFRFEWADEKVLGRHISSVKLIIQFGMSMSAIVLHCSTEGTKEWFLRAWNSDSAHIRIVVCMSWEHYGEST